MNDNDAELVAQYLTGDPRAFELLYTRYQTPLFNYIYRCCSCAAVAEDIFQEVFFQVVKKMAQYSEKQSFKAWIYTIAHNRIIDRSRLKSSNDVHINNDWDPSGAQERPDRIVEKKESRDLVLQEINKMPKKTRDILMLRHFTGLSFKEVAEITATPLGTVLSQAHRGLDILREKIA